MRRTAIVAAFAAVLGVTLLAAAPASKSKGASREFTTVNIEYKGTKVWVPATFIVKRGEDVQITLINQTPSGKHGFAIDEFGVKDEAANDGKPRTVKFKADRAGLFRIYCHLHPAHIGGQLLVLD